MRVRPALIAAAAAALVLGTAGPSAAGTQTRTDQAGDAYVERSTDNTTPEGNERAAEGADIRTLSAVHGNGALKFTFTVADLIAPADNYTTVRVRIVTPSQADYTAVMGVGGQEKTFRLERQGGSADVACDGLGGRLLGSKDQLVLSVPRSCVRNPRSVRFGGRVDFAGVTGEEGVGYASDDARRNGNSFANSIQVGTRPVRNN